MSKQSSRHTPCAVAALATDGVPAPALTATNHGHRRAFTLIELLVAITIIGILSAMTLGGMYRANVAAKQVNTNTTINKVAAQIGEIWGSYRDRKLPIDPTQILQSNGTNPTYLMQYNAATGSNGMAPGWLPYFSTIRSNAGIPSTSDPINATQGTFGVNGQSLYANNIQIAALRLAATRELIRLEMPCRFSDFTRDYTQLLNAPPIVALMIPQPLNASGQPQANPGGLSEQYRQFYRTHATTANLTFESAECLYMIIKFASQNDFGQKNITDDPRLVGDSDGDGMPEIQDAFLNGTATPAPIGAAYIQRNMPIAFIRWPAGYLSELQPGPNSVQLQTPNPAYEYASARHDIYDPLRVDPRAFTITPLVFSAGVDVTYDIWEHNAYANLSGTQVWFAQNDPYYIDSASFSFSPFPIISGVQNPWPGTQMAPGIPLGPNGLMGSGGYNDNITNHLLNTRGR
jgi:prepilin-type N-terminal cleavage/methylation domain-containing protein